MATNYAIRGQEVSIHVTVEGEAQEGSWSKVKDFTVTPRTELIEADYLGQYYTDVDKQYSGFDFSFNLDMQDRNLIDFLNQESERERLQQTPRRVTIQVIYSFRDASGPVGETYFDAVLKVSDQSMGSRTEYVSVSVEGKAKRRSALSLD